MGSPVGRMRLAGQGMLLSSSGETGTHLYHLANAPETQFHKDHPQRTCSLVVCQMDCDTDKE